jgi:hypothetical protein
MPKSKTKVIERFKENFGVLKKNYKEVCRKNVEFAKVNSSFYLAEQKWRKENSYLRQENSIEVSKSRN